MPMISKTVSRVSLSRAFASAPTNAVGHGHAPAALEDAQRGLGDARGDVPIELTTRYEESEREAVGLALGVERVQALARMHDEVAELVRSI